MGQPHHEATEDLETNTRDGSTTRITEKDKNKYCLIKYDGELYPGVILDVEENDIQVHCMTRIGPNRFFWCTPVLDILWYPHDDVVCLIPQPKPVTSSSRHFLVEPTTWANANRFKE